MSTTDEREAWRPADIAAVRAQRAPGGLYRVWLWPDRPPLVLDLGALVERICDQQIGNPLLRALERLERLRAAEAAAPDAAAPDAAPDAAPPAADAPAPAPGWVATVRRTQAVIAQEDQILATLLVAPPYCPLDRLPRGRRPADALCYWDFTPEQRQLLFNVAFAGPEALAGFRCEPAGPAPVPDGPGVRPAAERVPAG